MNSRRAFALQDLVIVIGLGAIGAVLCLPALATLRSHTRGIECRSNLRALGVATALHVEQNNGIMPLASKADQGNNLRFYDWTWEIMVSGHWQNFGVLWEAGLLDDPQALFCPNETSSRFSLEHYAPWPTPLEETGGYIPSSYSHNPYVWDIEPSDNPWPSPGAKYAPRAYFRLIDMPQDKILGMDRLTDPAHRRDDTAAWNVLYPDGHVAFIESKQVLAIASVEHEEQGFPEYHEAFRLLERGNQQDGVPPSLER